MKELKHYCFVDVVVGCAVPTDEANPDAVANSPSIEIIVKNALKITKPHESVLYPLEHKYWSNHVQKITITA